MIGIGGRLATPPLPHHRAYGSVPRRFDRVRLGQAHGFGEDRASRNRRCVGLVGPPDVRTMGGAPRSKAVAVLGKRRVPPLLENLQHSLLKQSVDDARHAELSDPAVRLGDFDPFDRLRLIGSLKQLSPNVWPALTQAILGGVDGHSINARTALVASNALPRSFEIPSITHLLHELFRQARTFGCWLRHQWFGILGFGVQGFTPTLRHRGLGQSLAQSFLPRSAHESSVLIATLNRSGLRPSFPARPICFSAFRLWSASLALPTAWPNMPSADFCIRGQDALRRPQFRSWNTEQTSRGKFSRLPCAVAGSTLRVLDEYGLRD